MVDCTHLSQQLMINVITNQALVSFNNSKSLSNKLHIQEPLNLLTGSRARRLLDKQHQLNLPVIDNLRLTAGNYIDIWEYLQRWPLGPVSHSPSPPTPRGRASP